MGPLWRLALALALPGCAAGWRVGAGPTLDERGLAGAHVTLGGSFGLTADDRAAAQEFVALSGGGRLGPASPTAGVMAGLEYLSQGAAVGDATWRLGLHARLHAAADGDALGGGGLHAAFLFTNDVDGGTFRNFGGELAASAGVAPGGGHAVRGLLALALVYETNLFVDFDDLLPEKH